jgi:hypothetical protein
MDISYVQSILSENPFTLFPKEGDFSIVPHPFFQRSLPYDYNFFFNQHTFYGVTILLEPNKNLSSNFWKSMRSLCYPGHSDGSFKLTISFLEYIAEFGWCDFTIHINNLYNRIRNKGV